MGKISKKPKISAQNEQSSSESEENFDREDKEEEIDVEFEAFGICDKDIDGIVALLKQAYAHENLDVRGVAQILANQEGRGCIFMTAIDDDEKTSENDGDDDDDEIYGVVSYIDLKENMGENCVKEFLKILREKSSKNEQFDEILDKLETSGTSMIWLINERLINLPYHIALPALKNLS
uniref:Uncharacterized protein n=1 Tax=Romanomermis culicivorax TaxID=13658 RepID=A0A915JWU0_ROMCU